MILKCSLVLLGFCILVPKSYGMPSTSDDYPSDPSVPPDSDPDSWIQWTEVFYEDACKAAAEADWKLINNPTNQTLLREWEWAQANYSLFKKTEVAATYNLTDVEPDADLLRHKLSLIRQPGDALLNITQWNEFISFSGKAAILRTGVNHTSGSRSEVERMLSGAGTIEEKQLAWSNWHRELLPLVETYSSSLALVAEAAKANDVNNVATYWELLSGYPEGYERVEILWEEITKLHRKLLTFVRNRLAQKYKVALSADEIPAYLLGTLDGYDWTPIAADVMPYGNVSYSIMKNLWEKSLRGITLYRSASALESFLLNDVPEADFWQQSLFNQTCLNQFVNFCREGLTRVSTCHQASLGNFLSAHKIVAKVLMSQKREDSFPFLNTANRYSGLDEGISELFSILSVSPERLHTLNLVDNTTDSDHTRITSLMITALDVFPRLAYYMAADLWRINVIKNGTFGPQKLTESWWQYRKQYEGVTTDSSDIPTFLDDDFITGNKPYLPKFLGTIFAFQLYEHLIGSTEVRYDDAKKYENNQDLITMILDGGEDDWVRVIDTVMETTDVTEDAMLLFFAPLEEYLDANAEDTYSLTVDQERELDRLEKFYESTDVTSTTARPTSTTRRIPSKSKNPKQTIDATAKSSTSAPEKNPSGERESTSKKSYDGLFPEIEEVTESASGKEDYTDKMNTSKAVWAVAAVLIATVAICVIAIFGRRRCVKSQTPKNRRYV